MVHGFWKAADLVLFDPDTVADRAGFAAPHQYPIGVETVIVNGVVVLDRGQRTDALWTIVQWRAR